MFVTRASPYNSIIEHYRRAASIRKGAPSTSRPGQSGERAAWQSAGGDRDPKTGQCSSISTQYRIKAIPAFVVDSATESVNDALDK
jgi:hypothetical protein